MDNEPRVWAIADDLAESFIALSETVWDTPETCFMEDRSAAAHMAELKRQGFSARQNVAGMPTAVAGEAGRGGPVIAILGEYDALSGLSQQAGLSEQKPVQAGGAGHGCGHNLLGAGSLLVAAAVKKWLDETGTEGTIRYYGCPAEEGGSAKSFMVDAGLFDDVDIAVCWHPHYMAQVAKSRSLAVIGIDFSFHGRASHAAASPQLGRSALDAVELMSVGVNYMREHMPSSARIHYAILDTGGNAPNVVQHFAKVRYFVRAETVPEALSLLERVRKVAQGAALMTETRHEDEVLAACADLVPCRPLEDLLQHKIEELGAPQFSESDKVFARQIRSTLTPAELAHAEAAYDFQFDPNEPLADFLIPPQAHRDVGAMGSTDVGTVSWVVPTVQMHGANFAIGTPFHSWQLTGQGKTEAAHTGMVHAAKAMSAMVVDLFMSPELIAAAQRDHDSRAGKAKYVSPLPPGSAPAIDALKSY